MDRLDHALNEYDRGGIDRRQLLERLAAFLIAGSVDGRAAPAARMGPALRARTLNHVTIYASDVARSKAFYERVAGLPVRDEGKDFCEFRLEGGFLGLYAHVTEPSRNLGVDHFCLGIDGYEPATVHRKLKEAVPEAQPTLEYNDEQVYVRDPDGVRVQFADVSYKR